jgi:hypothetical protein
VGYSTNLLNKKVWIGANRMNERMCLDEKIFDLPVLLMLFTDEVLLSSAL